MANCFAMMPFGGYFDGYWRDIIRPALEAVGVEPVRADEIYSTGAIIEDIYSAILQSDVCIADVTDKNPNVSYELGMAHAAKKPTILITQHISDVPFDYRHLRHIVYNPMQSGWECRFMEALTNTVREAISNPARNIALKTDENYGPIRDADVMRTHLKNIFYVQAYDLDQENDIFIGGAAGCIMATAWRGTARSRLHHLCHNVVCDIACKIKVKRAYDVINARNLDYVTLEESANHKSYFVLLKQHKEPGQPYHIETEVIAPGYLDLNLLSSRTGAVISTQAAEQGIRYIRKTNRLHFPKENRFAGVEAEILSHPKAELIGSKVKAVEREDGYILKLTYDTDTPYQQETACRVYIS